MNCSLATWWNFRFWAWFNFENNRFVVLCYYANCFFMYLLFFVCDVSNLNFQCTHIVRRSIKLSEWGVIKSMAKGIGKTIWSLCEVFLTIEKIKWILKFCFQDQIKLGFCLRTSYSIYKSISKYGNNFRSFIGLYTKSYSFCAIWI